MPESTLDTKLFVQMPWNGGVNTTLEESLVSPTQLTEGNNVVLGISGARLKREGINMNFDGETSGSTSLIGLHATSLGAVTKAQRMVSVANDRTVYSYTTGGTRTTLADDAGTTAWSGTPTQISIVTMNNLIIMATDTSTDVVHKWAGPSNDIFDLGGTPPKGSILAEHISRLWMNDQTDVDRLHYSTTGNPEEWNGAGDSGAIDIGIGDGDSSGITSIFSFMGIMFAAKRNKIYKIDGSDPETFKVSLLSDAIGVISHNSIVEIDGAVMWVSERGVHRMTPTDRFGNIAIEFVSRDIQKTFNEDFDFGRLKFTHGGYMPSINSVAFTFTQERVGDDTNFGATDPASVNNTVWAFNIIDNTWYRLFDSLPCQSLISANDADQVRFYIGSHNTRLIKTFTGAIDDTTFTNTTQAVPYKVSTGRIFPDQNMYTMKQFKYFAPIFKTPAVFTALLKVDNGATQSIKYEEFGEGDKLDDTFILDQSTLGTDKVLAPHARAFDGRGRSVKITIEQNEVGEGVEIQGFAVEYQDAGVRQEVI